MRAAERRMQPPQPERVIAEIHAGIAALFERCPSLSGFTLDGALCIGEVSVHAWPGDPEAEIVRQEIAYALLELVEQHPEAGDLLRDRTFARTLH